MQTAADLIRTVMQYLLDETPQTEPELPVPRNAAPNQKNAAFIRGL